ncbi:MAG: cyclic nucleotide-binding domain-containing protein, partial [Fibrobacteria bacterium]|nr:cyclic nucleotide-binding domain-containing protein [Fibrobacteria bacterium]
MNDSVKKSTKGKEPSKVKSGKRPKPIKNFSPGEVLFTEGEMGKELFLIAEGEVVVTRGEKEDKVELARLGAGSLVGEMALFDEGLRSATVTTTKDTKTIITSEKAFNEMFRLLPMWLSSIIKIMITRLREINNAIGSPILKNYELGVARLLLLKAIKEGGTREKKQDASFNYFECLSEIQLVTRLKKEDALAVIDALSKRELISIIPMGKTRLLHIIDIPTLNMFAHYHSDYYENRQIQVKKLGTHGMTILKTLNELVRTLKLDEDIIYIEEHELISALQESVSLFESHMLAPFYEFGLLRKLDGTAVELMPGQIQWAMDLIPFQEIFSRKILPEPSVYNYVTATINKPEVGENTSKGIMPKFRLEHEVRKGESIFKE